MKKHSIRYQLKSFVWAFNGLSDFFRTEVKAKIHSLAFIGAVLAGIFLKISLIDWCILCFASGLVFITEIFNTALERITDTLPDKFDKTRGLVKDLGAGCVLLSSFMALVIGAFIFIPKILALWI